MSTTTARRRAGGLALATACTATMCAAAPSVAAAQTSTAARSAAQPSTSGTAVVQAATRTEGRQRKPPAKRPAAKRPAAGFRAVRTTAAPVVAMHSPARGQVWFLERDASGRIILQRNDDGRWSTTRLPVTHTDYQKPDLHGSAANDVWVTAGGQLWRFDGRRWSRVGLPAGARATTVHDVPGPSVYVGLSGDLRTTGIYRLERGRWTSLGRPADSGTDTPYGPSYTPTDLTRTDGRWFATWLARPKSAAQWEMAAAYENGTWKPLYQTYMYGSGTYVRLGAWLVPTRDDQLVFTTWRYSSDDPSAASGSCTRWTKAHGTTQPCRTTWAVGAAAVLPNGNIVLGGDDVRRAGQAPVEGTFGIRTKAGVEKYVGGDPGDATLAMTVEPRTTRVWAATKKGDVTTIQRWDG